MSETTFLCLLVFGITAGPGIGMGIGALVVAAWDKRQEFRNPPPPSRFVYVHRKPVSPPRMLRWRSEACIRSKRP